MLGYEVADHVVRIDYYRPRGDQKEAWDNIDVVGFLGQKMQMKIDFLCRDSVLAAPLALELARVLDLAQRRGESGAQEQLGFFFKAPMTIDPTADPIHAMHEQERVLFEWLHADSGDAADTTRTVDLTDAVEASEGSPYPRESDADGTVTPEATTVATGGPASR
jgi:myo-inositol-1-phosphate synthase